MGGATSMALSHFWHRTREMGHPAENTLELKRKGEPIPTNDVWIAALCRQHSLPLLGDDQYFDLAAGIKRIGW